MLMKNFRILFALIIISGLLYAVYYISQTYKQKWFSGEMKVKDRLTIDKSASLVVVEYKDSDYFFSISEKSVNLIKEIPLSS